MKAPINLFLQEQLDQEKSQMQNTEQEEKLQEFEENMTQEEVRDMKRMMSMENRLSLATEGKGRQIEACIFVQSPSWEL